MAVTQRTFKTTLSLVFASILISLSAVAASDMDAATTSIKDEIWEKELAIYEARSRGDLSVYIANTHPGYKGWPPAFDVPKGLPTLRQDSEQMASMTNEELTMEFTDLVTEGDTAVIYYMTHRTVMPDGTPVDQRYHVTHVWISDAGEWKLFGAMARQMQ